MTIFVAFQNNFVCRSVEYNYVTLQCRLSDYDRRTPVDDFKPIDLVEAQGIDYFENLCLEAESSCEDQRGFATPRIGVPEQKIALHVNVHFYTDKELMVRSSRRSQSVDNVNCIAGQQSGRLPESL